MEISRCRVHESDNGTGLEAWVTSGPSHVGLTVGLTVWRQNGRTAKCSVQMRPEEARELAGALLAHAEASEETKEVEHE